MPLNPHLMTDSKADRHLSKNNTSGHASFTRVITVINTCQRYLDVTMKSLLLILVYCIT